MSIFIVILVSVLLVAILLTVIGLRRPEFDENRIMNDRLNDLSQVEGPLELRKLELSLPFQERVIYPIARKLGELAI